MESQTEIIAKLQSDALYALGFAVDNNPDGVIVALKDKGFVEPLGLTTLELRKKWAFETLKGILMNNKKACISLISAVPYNKNATNYTAGLLDYFMNTQNPNTVTAAARFDINALLGGLGAGLSTYTGMAMAAEGGLNEPTAAEKQAEEEAAAKEAAAKKQKMIYWGLGIVGAIVVVVIIVAVVKRKKTT